MKKVRIRNSKTHNTRCGRKVMKTGNAVHEPTMLLPRPSHGS